MDITKLKPLKVGLLLAILTVLYGYGLGIVFGSSESSIKGTLKSDAKEVMDMIYKNDNAKLDKVTSKSWVYIKRAHMHANGMGTTAIALIFVLATLPTPDQQKKITAIALGFGSLGYSMFWMFAGFNAPVLGSTGLAKEGLAWLAIPASSASILGVVATLYFFIKANFNK